MSRDLTQWTTCGLPGNETLTGPRVELVPFDPAQHPAQLFCALGGPANQDIWTYIPFGQPASAPALGGAFNTMIVERGWKPMVVIPRDGERPLGMFSYMRLRPEHGSAEIGALLYGHELQRTAAATEVFCLAAAHLFDDLGYRRLEWKCNARNAASRRAAERFGFAYEGRFRQDMVIRGENRDTDWYAMLDADWPARRAALEGWLAPGNFAEDGGQKKPLAAFHQDLQNSAEASN